MPSEILGVLLLFIIYFGLAAWAIQAQIWIAPALLVIASVGCALCVFALFVITKK